MKVIVMGAGIIGVTSAWYLSQAGHDVTVLERNTGPAQETSFANGGQISVCHAEPWANPSAPLKLLSWLGREDAPLLFRLRADPQQWAWGLRFLLECPTAKALDNTRHLVRLGTYSRNTLQTLRRETGIEYDHLTRGILHYFTSKKAFEDSMEPTRVMRELGCERRVIDIEEAVRIEPALAHLAPEIVGATYTSEDESGDAHAFTRRLAERCEANGVRFCYGTRVQRLHVNDRGMAGVEYNDATGAYQLAAADAYVLALGSYSRAMAKQAGLSLAVYPVKGYSASLSILDPERAPMVSLTDDAYKMVFTRLGSSLRVAGTAEFNGYDTSLNRVRCEALVERTMQVFPGVSRPELATYWTGLRPATPGNLPYIGRSKVPGLYLNTGHGTLGWTHGCGSGLAIADIISGRQPDCDFPFQG
jgi:D-amino-acid dehydrogenase